MDEEDKETKEEEEKTKSHEEFIDETVKKRKFEQHYQSSRFYLLLPFLQF